MATRAVATMTATVTVATTITSAELGKGRLACPRDLGVI